MSGIEAKLKKIVTVDTTSKLNSRHHTLFKIELNNIEKIFKKLNLSYPYDEKFTKLFINTAVDCFNQHNFYFGHVGFNEITYYLKPINKEQDDSGFELDYNGKIQKMLSLITSRIQSKFINNLFKITENDVIFEIDPCFETKIWQLNYYDEIINYFCEKINTITKIAKSQFISKYLNQKDIDNLSTKECLKKILLDKQIDFNDEFNDADKYGVFIYFELNEFKTDVEINGKNLNIKYTNKIPKIKTQQPSDLVNIKITDLA